MKPASKIVASFLGSITGDLNQPGATLTIDNARGAFMAFQVEYSRMTRAGRVLVLAHYFEQNGDLVPDPEMEVLRDPNGHWYPLSYRDQFGHRECVRIQDDGQLLVTHNQYQDLRQFLTHWMRNVRSQQGI